jgi:cytoskeleton protein RodZ
MRSYADFLGLDSEEVVRRSKDEIASQSVDTQLVFPVPIPESSIPGGAIVLVGIVIFLLAYSGWYVNTSNDADLGEAISNVPEHLSLENQRTKEEKEPGSIVVEQTEEFVPKVVQSAAPNADESTELKQETVQNETNPITIAQNDEVLVDERVNEGSDSVPIQVDTEEKPTIKKIKQEVTTSKVKPTAVEETAQNPLMESELKIEPVQPEPVESSQETGTVDDEEPILVQAPPLAQISADNDIITENKIYGSENEDSKILVRARRNSWIQVRDNKANKLLLTQLLKTGDSYQVPNRSGLVLLTGNAGALEILVEGKTVPDLAPPGTIMKNITLDPDKLRQGVAAQ